MNPDHEKLLIYFENETHLVRRLGAAVVACWKNLPESVQSLVVQKAEMVIDEDSTVGIEAQIRRFLADHERRTEFVPGVEAMSRI